jgi:hypothetical protein
MTTPDVLACGISRAAFDLIVAEEVTSEDYYRAHHQRPEWPNGSSGITIGIGYDCGYSTPEQIKADWSGKVGPDMIDALCKVAGLTGDAAQAKLAWIRPRVVVPWEAAISVFTDIDMPRWAARVRASLPNTDKLSPDCFGVLVSLAYNRGVSFSKAGARYSEMRSIKAHMAGGQFAAIPDDIRAMKRLWTSKSVRGVALRRDREAALFERGLKAPAAPQPRAPVAQAQPAATTLAPGSSAAVAPAKAAAPADYHSPLWRLGAALLPSIFKKGA